MGATYMSFGTGTFHVDGNDPLTQEQVDSVWHHLPTTGAGWVEKGHLFVQQYDGAKVFDLGPVATGVKGVTDRTRLGGYKRQHATKKVTRARRAHTTKKSPRELQRDIDEVLAKGSSRATAWPPRSSQDQRDEVTSTAGLMTIASAVARELKRSGMTWGDTSRARGRDVRIWSSGTSVRFEVPSRYQGHPSDAQAIVELFLVGPDRSQTSVGPFAGDTHYDKRFGEAMEQRVWQVLKTFKDGAIKSSSSLR